MKMNAVRGSQTLHIFQNNLMSLAITAYLPCRASTYSLPFILSVFFRPNDKLDGLDFYKFTPGSTNWRLYALQGVQIDC